MLKRHLGSAHRMDSNKNKRFTPTLSTHLPPHLHPFTMRAVLATIVLCTLVGTVESIGAATPTMGYSTWNYFPYKGVNETTCYALANAMVKSGLVAAGYTVFIVDEPCFTGRDASGALLQNTTTWPNGLAKFAAFLKTQGMSLGIYTDAGPLTCQQCPASEGHEAQDMATFKEWGITYVKVDRCFGVDSPSVRKALPETFAKYETEGMQVSMILAGTDNCWVWGNKTSVSCRSTGDIHYSYSSMLANVDNQEKVPGIDSFAGPGFFNDLDMLMIGTVMNGRETLTYGQAVMQQSIWAALKSPLLVSNDVTSANKTFLDVMLNPEVIAVNQDPLGVQAKRVFWSAKKPAGVSFQECVAVGVTDGTQKWGWDGSGKIISNSTGECLGVTDGRVGMVDCGTANEWKWRTSPTDGKITSVGNDSVCLQGRLGPGATSIAVVDCAVGDLVEQGLQKWSLDGTTLRVNTTCLSATYPQSGTYDLYAGPLSNGASVAVWANRGATPLTIKTTLALITAEHSVTARDLWSHKDVGTFSDTISLTLDPESAVMYKLTPA